MPRIDPQQLLNCLIPLLAPNGGIKSSGEVVRLASLMEKYSKKLVSKCIYTQVLKCTETDLLDQFMEHGGWNLVHNWLSDGEKSCNWPFIQEILEMLLLCPVDGTRLKSNITPKVVKNLSLSCPHNTVRILSTKLVEQWLKIAHQEKQHSEKQQLTTSQTNGLQNGTNNVNNDSSHVLNDNKVNETLHNEATGQVSEDDLSKKQSKENVKYKISNKEGSGKLLLSLKRSTSPSVEEKDSKLTRSSSLDSKDSKTKSSSSDKDKDKQKKSSSSHKSSSSLGSSSKSSHRDKERSSSTSSSRHKSSSSSSRDKNKDSSKYSSSKSSSRSTSRDKDKDKEKRPKDPEKSQAEKDKETLNLLVPMSSSKLQRIPKRQHSDNSENKSSESNKDPSDASSPNKIAKSSEPVEKKKPSISIEVRKGEKPKTVKTLNSQFRNHGLAEEPPKPPSRKDLKKPTAVAPLLLPTSLPSATLSEKKSISPPPSKKVHLEKALERVGGIKLIKPKPMLIESIGFMDALSASTLTKKDPKKRKRLSSNSKKDEPESPKIEVKPLKFYKDTFEETEEEKTNGEKSPTKELDTSGDEKKLKTETKKKEVDSSPEESIKSNGDDKEGSPDIEERNEKRPPGVGCGPDGPPGVLVHPNVPRRKKRPIRWRSDEELTEVRFFELDETERTNVSKTFTEQKQMEHVEERSAFKLGRKAQNDDTMVEQTTWRALNVIDFKEEPKVNYGCNSREAVIQAEREKNVLQELYFRHSINDSPHEPDPETYEHIEPQIIPLNDVTGNPDSVNNYTDINWPAPKGDLPSTFSSNAFANVFSHINVSPATGVPPVGAFTSPITNPLANFPMGGILNPLTREPIAPNQWLMPPTPFMQPPPAMISQPLPVGFPNNRGGMNNGFRNNNSRPNNNSGGGNWVRGNARRGVCNQFQRNGFCRNNNCPYIHER